MYDINLIRHRLVPQRHKNVVFSLLGFSALAYVLTILAVVVFSIGGTKTIDVYASDVATLRNSIDTVSPAAPPSAGQVQAMVEEMKPNLIDIGGLVEQKEDFVPLWRGVAAAVPDSVWLTGVRVMSPGKAGQSSSGRSKAKARFRGIVIEGMTAAGVEGGGDLIRRFARRLEGQAELKDYIAQAKFVETGIQTIGGTDVIGFEITCPYR
jgi:hypothetical protein